MRFNSWDIIMKPAELYHGIGSWTVMSVAYPGTIAFPLLFAAFLFIAYLMLYALTHLSPAEHAPLPAGSRAGER